MLSNFCVCKPQNSQTIPFQNVGADLIILFSIYSEMMSTVNFYYKLCRRAVKICDEALNDSLPLKPNGIFAEKAIPKAPLLRCHRLAQFACRRF